VSASTSNFASPDTELHAAIALALKQGIGPARHRELVQAHGDADSALRCVATAPTRAALIAQAAALVDRGRRARMGALCSTDERYPPGLLDLPDPPPVLWYLGSLTMLEAPLVSIVGTRRCSTYGERITRELATALARARVTVVSGMAVGVDSTAHQAALDVGGRTVAILGTGVDVPYPAGHRALHARLAGDALILSEALPGAPARPGVFPRRNRIIAALSPTLVVVEAGQASGALITARVALDLGRTIAAVPGPIDAPQSAGSNELLRDGAVVIATIADALALVGATPRVVSSPPPDDADAAAVWHALAGGALDADTLCSRSQLPAARCMSAVTMLELSGRVECALTGEIRRR
jgi:DNA processing protein